MIGAFVVKELKLSSRFAEVTWVNTFKNSNDKFDDNCRRI